MFYSNLTGSRNIVSSLTIWLFESRQIPEDFQRVSVRSFLSQTDQYANPALQIGRLTRPQARSEEPLVF